MSISYKSTCLAFSLLCCVALSGCGNGAPSDAAVRNALKQVFEQDMGVTNVQQLSPAQKNMLASVTIGTKTKQNDGSYDVVLTVYGHVEIMKIAKGGDGWQVLNPSDL